MVESTTKACLIAHALHALSLTSFPLNGLRATCYDAHTTKYSKAENMLASPGCATCYVFLLLERNAPVHCQIQPSTSPSTWEVRRSLNHASWPWVCRLPSLLASGCSFVTHANTAKPCLRITCANPCLGSLADPCLVVRFCHEPLRCSLPQRHATAHGISVSRCLDAAHCMSPETLHTLAFITASRLSRVKSWEATR